jgi:hypothetical protein
LLVYLPKIVVYTNLPRMYKFAKIGHMLNEISFEFTFFFFFFF